MAEGGVAAREAVSLKISVPTKSIPRYWIFKIPTFLTVSMDIETLLVA